MKFAYERIVYLPLDLAIIHAAAQNFRLDFLKGVYPRADWWTVVSDDYKQEAYNELAQNGFNMYPGYNEEPWIHVSKLGPKRSHTPLQAKLESIYTVLFERNDEDIFDTSLFPTPQNAGTYNQINRLEDRVDQAEAMIKAYH